MIEGMAIGLFLGVAARALVRAVLVAPIQIVDPVVFSVVPIPLLLAALPACWLPAAVRRASIRTSRSATCKHRGFRRSREALRRALARSLGEVARRKE